MSVLDCCAAAITGTWDNFDSANAVADWIEEMLEEAEMPIELHNLTGSPVAEFFGTMSATEPTMHVHDPKEACREQLERARQLVNEARLICQLVLEQI